MLKFLVDESSGKKLDAFLLARGFDSKFVADVIPGAPDSEVLRYAQDEGRILITNDKDFGELIFRLNSPSSGVILLRLRSDMPKQRQLYVERAIALFSHKLPSSFIAVTEGKIRLRKLKP